MAGYPGLLWQRAERAILDMLIEQKVDDEIQTHPHLTVASRFGYKKIVGRLLLLSARPNLEKEVTLSLRGCVVEGVTALWCAAAAGHLDVVKLLINAGANVNHATKLNSTPLHAACYAGKLDIAMYLVEHEADIHAVSTSKATCLMIAVGRGHLDLVTFLLQVGAITQHMAAYSARALHVAVDRGYLGIVKVLLQHGALITENEDGCSPLIVAAKTMKTNIVEYFVSRPEFYQLEKIDALELLGASFACDRVHYSRELAYQYLHQAMEIRYSDPDNLILKDRLLTIPAYDNWNECKTLEELVIVQHNRYALHMESLSILERILGSNHPDVPISIVFHGSLLAEEEKYGRCVELWLHALHLRQQNKVAVSEDLRRFVQIFSLMMYVEAEMTFSWVKDVLASCVVELKRNKEATYESSLLEYDPNMMNELQTNITTVLYILVITTKLMKLSSPAEEFSVHQLVFQLNKLKLKAQDGQSFLHLCVNAKHNENTFCIRNVCKFPCVATIQLLIKCGADVNAYDKFKNTPLHIVASLSDVYDLPVYSVIIALIKAGAHPDSVNARGKTPYELAMDDEVKYILQTHTTLSLKCFAAKAVKFFNIPYEGQVPQTLESFIEMHGPDLPYE